MQENHSKATQQDVLYVYDRICSKNSKNRQILREYGTCAADAPDAQPMGRASRPMSRTSRPMGKAFAESQRKRAEEYLRANPGRTRTSAKTAWTADSSSVHAYAAEDYTYTDGNGNEYVYRPAPVSGGAAVRQRPLKLLLEQIINMFESLDSRRKRDEETAKKQAIAHKKFTENRHALLTAVLLLLVTILFVGFVYLAFFVISDVEVRGTDLYSKEDIVEAAGFSVGDNLYSFHAGRAEESILFYCPRIQSAQISRTLPNSVDIELTEDTAVYYADVYGDILVLSAGLRVLGVTDCDAARADGLIQLVLPAVRDSVAGRAISFAEERNLRYVRSILGAVAESSLGGEGRISKIDLSDEYGVTMNCDGRYFLKIGNEKDCDLKLRMAYKTIGNEAFDREMPASIDVSKVGEASVRYDMRLIVE
ncbi:MAG: cell division protein FtsQ/DivIB [Eubacteriales bacterium]